MSTTNKKSDAIKDALKITVSAVVVGGKFLAWQVKDLYGKFDPAAAKEGNSGAPAPKMDGPEEIRRPRRSPGLQPFGTETVMLRNFSPPVWSPWM